MRFLFLFLISLNCFAQGYQAVDAVGTLEKLCDTREVCEKVYGETIELTVNPNYAKLIEIEIDDYEKPIYQENQIPCEGQENLVEVCTETVLLGYEKMIVKTSVLDEEKHSAFLKEQIVQAGIKLQEDKTLCGDKIVSRMGYINSTLLAEGKMSSEQFILISQRTAIAKDFLKVGALVSGLAAATNVDIAGTGFSEEQKQEILTEINKCISLFN